MLHAVIYHGSCNTSLNHTYMSFCEQYASSLKDLKIANIQMINQCYTVQHCLQFVSQLHSPTCCLSNLYSKFGLQRLQMSSRVWLHVLHGVLQQLPLYFEAVAGCSPRLHPVTCLLNLVLNFFPSVMLLTY